MADQLPILHIPLPLFIYFVASYGDQIKLNFLIVGLILNILQAAPLKAAYFDENDPLLSTRQSSAVWINRNIPEGTAICVDTNSVAPYEVPPFDFRRYKIRDKNCQYFVKSATAYDRRNSSQQLSFVAGLHTPRFFSDSFPLVFEHINPVIYIYQHDTTTLK